MEIKLPILYSRRSDGDIQSWTIEINGDRYRTFAGIFPSGKLNTSEFTICEGKNIGKINVTSPENQALKEAQSLWQKKCDKGYKQDIKEIDDVSFFEPMLAKNWEDYKEVVEYPLYSNLKYNGMRCITRKDGMWSRNGKPIVSAPHIFNSVKHLFDKQPDLVLDGELYNHTLGHMLNKIISLAKKIKPTAEDLAESEKLIEYHVYDAVNINELNSEETYSKRHNEIEKLLKNTKYIFIVKADVANNYEELTKLYRRYIEDGYEGQIVRIDAAYQNKRTKYLLKRKEFKDAEYKVLDIIEGIGNKTGIAASVLCEDKDGNTFNSNIKGDFEYLAQILLDKEKYIGKMATVKYFELTEYGVPQFPYVIAFDDFK